MPINNGIVEMFAADGTGGGITAQIFYDSSIPFDPPNQAIIETGSGANRAAMLVTSTSTANAAVIVTGPTGSDTYTIVPGTTRVRLTQLQNRGITTRADLNRFELRGA